MTKTTRDHDQLSSNLTTWYCQTTGWAAHAQYVNDGVSKREKKKKKKLQSKKKKGSKYSCLNKTPQGSARSWQALGVFRWVKEWV